jgi:hypothetical protein
MLREKTNKQKWVEDPPNLEQNFEQNRKEISHTK